jgi:hypothetical protein
MGTRGVRSRGLAALHIRQNAWTIGVHGRAAAAADWPSPPGTNPFDLRVIACKIRGYSSAQTAGPAPRQTEGDCCAAQHGESDPQADVLPGA